MTTQTNNFEVYIVQRMDLLREEIQTSAERDRDAIELNLKLLDFMKHIDELLTEVISDVKKIKEQKIQEHEEDSWKHNYNISLLWWKYC